MNEAKQAATVAAADVGGLDISAIIKTLPHRYPFLLVDRVQELQRGSYIRAIKNVTINEPFFVGHFPVRPVMPGVLMIEALAQAAALLAFVTAGVEAGSERVIYLAGIDGARFKRPVGPGDQLVLEVWLERQKAGIHKYRTRATVDGQLTVECGLLCTDRAA